MNKLYFFIVITLFIGSIAFGQNDLDKQLKNQNKSAQSNDHRYKKSTKYDKSATESKRTKFLDESSKVGKVKFPSEKESQNSTVLKPQPSGPPAKSPIVTRAEAEKKNTTIGKVNYETNTQNSTVLKPQPVGPPAKNRTEVRAEAEKKNTTIGKVNYDANTQNSTVLKPQPVGPPAKNRTEVRAEAEKKNTTIGKVNYDANTQNSTVLKPQPVGPPAKNRTEVRAEAEKKNSTIGKVNYDANTQNSTVLKPQPVGPPARNREDVRAEAEKKNSTIGKVDYETNPQNPTIIKPHPTGPPARNREEVRSEAERKNETIGYVKNTVHEQRYSNLKAKSMVGQVKFASSESMQNPTIINPHPTGPPARNREEVRAEAEKKNETIGYVKNTTHEQKYSNLKEKSMVGQVKFASEASMQNPTVFAAHDAGPPNPHPSSIKAANYEKMSNYKDKFATKTMENRDAKRTALMSEMNTTANGDIPYSTREDQYNIRKSKSAEASKYSGTVNAKLVYDSKEAKREEMDKYSTGDVPLSAREDQYAVRKDKSEQSSKYTGSVSMAFVNERASQKETLKSDMEKYSTGDISLKTREEQYAVRQEKSKEMGEYQGTFNLAASNEKKENLRKDMEKYATGDVPLSSREAQYAIRKEKSKEMGEYEGSVNMNVMEARNQKRAELKADMEKYSTGDIPLSSREAQYAIRRQKSEEIANYTGIVKMSEIEARNKQREALKKEMGSYSGDIKMSTLANRSKMRMEKSREMAAYSGSFKVSDIEKKQKQIRANARDMAEYQGTIKLTYRQRGVHPSVAYRKGWANDFEKKQQLRKKMLKKSRKKGDLEKPNYLKNKLPKPGYDPREAEIWYK